MMGLRAIPSIDLSRPITAVVSQRGLTGNADDGSGPGAGIRNAEALIAAWSEGREGGHEVVEGIHRFEGEPAAMYLRFEAPFVIAGRDRDAVARFDRKRLQLSLDPPPGNVASSWTSRRSGPR